MTNITHPALLQAENEKLREALRWYEEKVTECRKIGSLGDNARQALDRDGGFRARDALSQQPEPTDTFTAVDMATANPEAIQKLLAERDAFLEARTSLIEENGHLYDEIAELRHALTLCVASLDQLLPYLAKVPADVGLLNGALVAARPLLDGTKQHPDDAAVDRFAAAMKAKLAKSRAKGRGGWDNPSVCTVEFLAQLLVEHLGKGNAGTFEDVANFAMMLHQRGADPMVLAEAAEAPIKKARGEALEAVE